MPFSEFVWWMGVLLVAVPSLLLYVMAWHVSPLVGLGATLAVGLVLMSIGYAP